MTSSTTDHRSADEIRHTGQGPRTLPATGLAGPMPEPPNVDVSLPNGLRVLAVRQPATPMVEIRLWIPFAGWETEHSARAELLAATITTGLAGDGTVAEALAPVGGSLAADVTPERLLITGRVLAYGLPHLLETLARLLTSPVYIGDELTAHQRQLVAHIRLMESDASVMARRALQRRRFGDHPMSHEMPGATAVAEVTPRDLRDLHLAAVLPRGATLVLVGDIDVDVVVGQVGDALADWSSRSQAQPLTSLPVITAAPLLFVPNEDTEWSQIRLCAQAVGRTNPRYPAVALANLVLGGYFSSRLTGLFSQDDMRCGVHSYVELHADSGSVVIEGDCGAAATVEVMNLIRYALGRLIYQPPDEVEVAAAREYALGTMHFAVATQTGMADRLAELAGAGLGMPWLLALHSRLRDTTSWEVTQAVHEFLAPVMWTGVVVADSGQLPALSRFCAVTVTPS